MDLEGLADSIRSRAAIEAQARARFGIGSSGAATRRARYEMYHRFYAPVDGDQWPEDRKRRPGKLHITSNIIKAFVDTESRVLSILPRLTNESDDQSLDARKKAEVVEKLFVRYLEESEWDVWMADFCRVKSLYGLGVLQPFWNNDANRPDVISIEQPQNLMLGYGTSDYSVIDWAIYRYSISMLEAGIRYPDLSFDLQKGKPPIAIRSGFDHTDPLGQRDGTGVAGLMSTLASKMNPRSIRRGTESEYEQAQVEVWDYWYRHPGTGMICNATLVQGVMTGDVREHAEYPAIPFIPVENDHEPGSPEGISTAEALIDTQMGLNRAYSQYAQIVADNSGNAYQLVGENADTVPEGIVPKEDEIVPAGSGNHIDPILRQANNYPIEALINVYWAAAHKLTGLPEIMFGDLPGSQTSGRATAVQIESAANRLDPKRRHQYSGLRTLLLFWGFMLKKRNPTVTASAPAPVPEDPAAEPAGIAASQIQIGEFIKGFERWKIVAPEITPRDAIEHTQNVINQVQAKLLPLEMGMDELGIDNPQYMLSLIEKERSNPRLFPGDAQAFLATLQLLGAIQAERQQQAAAAAQQAQGAANGAQADTAEMNPTVGEDQNQPMTQAGSATPAGAPPIGGELQPIIRQTPGGESQAMSQIQLPRVAF